MTTTPPPAGDASPIQDFSQCHVGIVSHLRAMAELPALLDPAARARQIASETIKFFRDVVYQHHEEEERELFPAVLASARKGEEHDQVKQIASALTAEHRQVESAWERLEPKLKAVAKGHDSNLQADEVAALVDTYLAHARYEEQVFLPLSQTILGRDGNHMAALGVSMHMRHAMPQLMERFGHRI